MPPRATPLVLHPPSARHASLPQVLPSVAASMGVPGFGPADNTLGLAPARSSVVVLIDGLGERLLRRRSGHAPFLRSLLAAGASLECGFPATTATSLASLGTGLTAGGHGLLGYQLRIPGSDRLFDHLSWEGGPDPLAWQPSSTIFERVVGADVDVVRIGLGRFDGSGLTTAALRGGRYVAAASLAQGVRAALAALRRSPSVLVYLYWGEVDRVGHGHGCGSREWGAALEEVDAELRRLAERLPAHASMHVTADHGMVDVPFGQRLDLAVDTGSTPVPGSSRKSTIGRWISRTSTDLPMPGGPARSTSSLPPAQVRAKAASSAAPPTPCIAGYAEATPGR